MRNFLSISLIFGLFLIASEAVSEVHNVPSEFPSIQDALNVSASGDVVLVQPGVYYEAIIWPPVNGIRLASAGNEFNTIIDGEQTSNSYTIYFTHDVADSNTIISGFTVRNSRVYLGFGCAIVSNGGSCPKLENLIIYDQSMGYFGTGISLVNLSDDKVFVANNVRIIKTVGDEGGCIGIEGGSIRLNNCLLYNNIAYCYSAIYANCINIEILESTFVNNNYIEENNPCPLSYNGLYLIGESINIIRSNFFNNGTSLNVNVDDNQDCQATVNWWGHSTGPYVPSQGLFGQGDTLYGNGYFVPFLEAPHPDAPPIPIMGIAVDSTTSSTISVSWDPSPIPDLMGYKIYYDTDSPEYPFSVYAGYTPDICYTITNLNRNQTYYISVTCIDTDGNESWFTEGLETIPRHKIKIPQDYSSIQEGLENAWSGDTVFVQAGTYYENLVWPETYGIVLKPIGENGSVIIDGSEIDRVVLFDNAAIDTNTRLSGVVLQGGFATTGAGIQCINGASPMLEFLKIMYNSTPLDQNMNYKGGGIYALNSSPVVRKSEILNNYASYSGGGIFLDNAGAVLKMNIIERNVTSFSGGGIACSSSSPIIIECKLVNNSSDIQGGGMFISNNTNPSIQNLLFHKNEAISEGGALFIDNSNPVFYHCTFSENSALIGDGLFINEGLPSIGRCNFENDGSGLDNNGSYQVNASENWWGAASGPYHQELNPGGVGDSISGNILFLPYFADPEPEAPIPPVKNPRIISHTSSEIELEWDLSLVNNISGYLVYYDNDQPGRPYSMSVDVGLSGTVLISGLQSSQRYYCSVICYNSQGDTSWFSNEIVGETRVIEAQNLTVQDCDDLCHLISGIPTFAYDYFDTEGQPQGGYRCQVSTDSSFSTIDMWDSGFEIREETSIIYAGDSLIDGEYYFVRVIVESIDGWSSPWCHPMVIRLNSEPTPPIPIYPENSSEIFSFNGFIISQSLDQDSDSLSYQFSVYYDEMQDSIIISSPEQNDTTWNPIPPLNDDHEYWWRCFASDGYETSGSQLRSFCLDVYNNPPAEFHLLQPENGSCCVSGDTTLLWQQTTEPDIYDSTQYYIVWFSRTSDFSSQVDSFITTGNFLEIHDLQQGIPYWWKVRAQDSNTAGTWSEEVWAINGYSPQSPTYFSLISPAHESELDTIAETFIWERAFDFDPSDTVRFLLELSLNAEFTDTLTIYYSAQMDTSFPVPYMLDDNDYWWRVIAYDCDYHLTYSNEVFTIHTAMPEPPEPFEIISGGFTMNSTNDSVQIALAWERAIDPDPNSIELYKILMDTTEDFFSPYVLSDSVSLGANDSIYVWDKTIEYSIFPILTEYFITIYAYDNNTLGTWAVDTLSLFLADVNDPYSLRMPIHFDINSIYPNPFNSATTVNISLPETSELVVTVYNVVGQKIATIADGVYQGGNHLISFNGSGLASGVYLIHAVTPGKMNKVKKVVLMK